MAQLQTDLDLISNVSRSWNLRLKKKQMCGHKAWLRDVNRRRQWFWILFCRSGIENGQIAQKPECDCRPHSRIS